jgi:hypothetical protein
MRGVTLISAILFIAITLTAVTIVYNSGMPVIKRLSTAAAVEQMKDVFQGIDSTVKEVAAGGNGSRRTLFLSLDPGKFTVDPSSDSVYWTLDTDALVISPRSSQTYGNVVFGSEMETAAYEDTYQGASAYVLENSRLTAYLLRAGSPGSPQPLSTSDLLLGLYSKGLGRWLNGSLEILMDGEPASSQGSGYTAVEAESSTLPKGVVEAHMFTPYLNYTIYFTLESGADFLMVEAEEQE